MRSAKPRLLAGRFVRLVALWLILLTTLPWTAPFATLDWHPVAPGTPAIDAGNVKSTHHHVLVAPMVGFARPAFPPGPPSAAESRPGYRVRGSRPIVLRI